MNVLLVEDESVIRNGLQKHIAWETLGVRQLRAAANAEEAEAICGEFSPDLVLSDIRMPGKDGITMCRDIRKHFPECEIIFITGFDDRDYLKAAIDLNVVKYIEKPVQVDRVSEAVREAAERMERVKVQKSAYLHSLFLKDLTLPVNLEKGNHEFYVGCLRMQKTENIFPAREVVEAFLKERKIPFLVEIFDKKTLILLLADGGRHISWEKFFGEVEETVNDNLQQIQWVLSFGKRVTSAEKLKESYESAVQRQEALAYCGWNHMICEKEYKAAEQSVILEQERGDAFAAVLAKKDREEAVAFVRSFYHELKEKHVCMNGKIRYTWYLLAQIADHARRSFYPENIELALEVTDAEFFEQTLTYEEMYRYLRRKLEKMFENGGNGNASYTVKQVTEYVLKHYGDSELSIKELADHVGLTPTYLSNLFKKSTGMTVGQYLTDVRVEHARRLMKNSTLKFYEIAAQVGYQDANYFARIFKKKTGLTPKDYKEGLENG